uniref:SH3 domain-containing protein n=1 Tax=Strix occidentalis caurina TaxID=311401 RepID=A0A8D0L0Q5_STROC
TSLCPGEVWGGWVTPPHHPPWLSPAHRRAEYPNGELVPGYIPVFSDGWLPPPVEQGQPGGAQDLPPPASVSPTRSQHSPFSPLPCFPPLQKKISRAPFPAQGLVRALYEFQGRNPQELSIRMGDTLQVKLLGRMEWGPPPCLLGVLERGASQVGAPSPAPSLHPHCQEGVSGGHPGSGGWAAPPPRGGAGHGEMCVHPTKCKAMAVENKE